VQIEALRAQTAREQAEAMAQTQALGLDPGHLAALGTDQARSQAALVSDRERILALKSRVEAVDGAITRTKEEAAIWGAVEPTASYTERRAQAVRLDALLTAVAPACADDAAAGEAHRNLAGVAQAMADRLVGLDALYRRAGAYRERLAAQLGMVEPSAAPPVLGPHGVANPASGLGGGQILPAPTSFATLIAVQDRRVARAGLGRRRSRAWGLGAALLGILLAVAWVLLAQAEPGTQTARLAATLDGYAADWRRALPWLPVATGALGLLAIGLLARGTQLSRRLATETGVRADLERDRQAAEQEHADLGHLENRPLPEAIVLLARLKDEAIAGAVSALMAGPEGDLLDAARLAERRRDFKAAATGLTVSLTRIKAETDQAIDALHDAVTRHAAEIARRDGQIAQEQGRVRRHAELITVTEGLRARGEALAHRLRVRDLATDLLAGAIHYISQRFNTEVRNLSADSLPKFTNGRYQHLQIDQDLKVKAFSSEKHDFMDLDEISSGTQRQIMLAVRLALSQKLVNSVIQGPQFVFLDEPFAFFDESRTASALAVLPQVSRDFTQIWVTSQTFPAASRFDLVIECNARESQSPRIRRPDPRG
jgi:hypothetical protein